MMADSTDDLQWTIFGVKLKPSAIAENIAASLVIALASFILLDLFTAFSNQLAGIMPKPGSATANVIDFTKIAIAVIFAGAFAWHLNRLGLLAANDSALTALHKRLTAGETAGAWYARTVRSAIFLTDRFFGDAGKATNSWKPHAFRLKKAAPLWTAASYDRCLLIALIYPIVCIYAVWAVTGTAGLVGSALGFVDGTGWPHVGRVFMLFAITTGGLIALRNNGKLSFAGAIIAAFPLLLVFMFAVDDAILGAEGLATVLILIWVWFGNGTGSLCVAAAVALGLGLGSSLGWFLFMLLSFAAAGSLSILRSRADSQQQLHIFYRKFSILMLLLCIFTPMLWNISGALTYFLPLLTLVNAPFDWLALGITRAFLRKGLEKSGLWPLGLGVIDLFISLFIVVLLGITVLIITQIFNATTVLGGAEKAVFDPLPALRDLSTPGLRNQPQYYWLYLMLLTTQIPAILNLGAGFLSVIRTGDFGNMWVLRLMGDGQGVGLWARSALAAVQAGQFALAMTAGGLLFYLLFIGFVTVEPFAAGNLIDLLLWIAEANWPARLLGVAG